MDLFVSPARPGCALNTDVSERPEPAAGFPGNGHDRTRFENRAVRSTQRVAFVWILGFMGGIAPDRGMVSERCIASHRQFQ